MKAEPLPSNPWDRWGWAFASIWLVFLIYPVIAAVTADVTLGWRIATLAAIAGFAVANGLGYSVWAGRPWPALALMIGFAAATLPVIGLETLAFTPYLAMLSALELPDPWWKWSVPVWMAVPLVSLLSEDGFPRYFFLMIWPVMLGGMLVRVFSEREAAAIAARGQFALIAERERVARDVHDVLGHSLTALSIKAELASRLIDADPDRAREELRSIQETARQALAEVRATVGGLRAANLETELSTAPRVLADAGIETRVVGEVADTDPRQRAMLAWVLRESVTNVVRHAGATSVVIELGPRGLSVTDDGAGMRGAEGNGLRGMRERVASAGGALEVSGHPGTTVRVVLP